MTEIDIRLRIEDDPVRRALSPDLRPDIADLREQAAAWPMGYRCPWPQQAQEGDDAQQPEPADE
jgi:hypothetical protein